MLVAEDELEQLCVEGGLHGNERKRGGYLVIAVIEAGLERLNRYPLR